MHFANTGLGDGRFGAFGAFASGGRPFTLIGNENWVWPPAVGGRPVTAGG